MIVTFYWGLRFWLGRFFAGRVKFIPAIRLAWEYADEPGIVDWFAIILLATILLGLAEASRG